MFNAASTSASPLAEEKVRQEIRHVLVEFILRRQEDRLVVDEEQEQVEEEQHHDAEQQHAVGGDAVLLGRDTILAVEWFQQIAKASADGLKPLRHRGTLIVEWFPLPCGDP